MKIGYLSDVRIPSRAASVIHVLKMCDSLERLGHDVSLFFVSNGTLNVTEVRSSYGIDGNFAFHGLTKMRVRGLAYVYALRIGWIASRRRAFDLVLSRSLPGSVICALLGVHVIYEAHMPTKEKGIVTDFLFRSLLRRRYVKGIVVISEALKRYFQETYDLKGKKLIVLPDAASPNKVHETKIQENGKLNIGYVGHLYKGRGIDLLIELARTCEWLHIHVVGGEPADVAYWRRVSDGIPNITFYGHVEFAETEQYRKMCDVLVAPYQDEVKVSGNRTNTAMCMSPLKIFEYMASEKPIVCSDLPALQEILDDRENAIFCKVDDIQDWRNALLELKNNTYLRKRLACNAYKTYKSRYTWEKRADKIIDSFTG